MTAKLIRRCLNDDGFDAAAAAAEENKLSLLTYLHGVSEGTREQRV